MTSPTTSVHTSIPGALGAILFVERVLLYSELLGLSRIYGARRQWKQKKILSRGRDGHQGCDRDNGVGDSGEMDALEQSTRTRMCENAITRLSLFYAKLKYNFSNKGKRGLGG